jgi:hypothetical protein
VGGHEAHRIDQRRVHQTEHGGAGDQHALAELEEVFAGVGRVVHKQINDQVTLAGLQQHRHRGGGGGGCLLLVRAAWRDARRPRAAAAMLVLVVVC